MLSYLMAIHFVLFGNSTNLKNFWKHEVIRRKRMDIWRLLREKKQRNRIFLFWWRLANEMYINGNKLHKKAAKKLNSKIINMIVIAAKFHRDTISFSFPNPSHPAAIIFPSIISIID